MSNLWFLVGIAAVLLLIRVISRLCWSDDGHPWNCKCRIHSQKWPRPGGTL